MRFTRGLRTGGRLYSLGWYYTRSIMFNRVFFKYTGLVLVCPYSPVGAALLGLWLCASGVAAALRPAGRGGFLLALAEIFNLAGGPSAGLSFYGVYALVVRQLVMQLLYTMFISNNRASFHLW